MRYLLLTALIVGGCSAPIRPPVTHEAYVWQRRHDHHVLAAIERAAPTFSGLVALGTEMRFEKGAAKVVRVDLAGPVRGVALRIGPFGEKFSDQGTVAGQIVEEAAHLVAKYRPGELQIDFDAGEAQIMGYARWLEAIRRRLPNTRLVVTLLPVHMDEDLAPILSVVDAFVLQVHGLRPPKGPDTVHPLFEVTAARTAIAQAATWKRPFRIALPTYSYDLDFDEQDKFSGLSAETGKALAGHHRVKIRTDPHLIWNFVRELERGRSRYLEGIIWFRLPTAADRNNWRIQTLEAIVRGEPLAPDLHAVLLARGPGLFDIVLENRGSLDAAAAIIEVHGPRLAHDILPGIDARVSQSQLTILPALARTIRAGERRPMGWVRTDATHELRTTLQTR